MTKNTWLQCFVVSFQRIHQDLGHALKKPINQKDLWIYPIAIHGVNFRSIEQGWLI